MSHDADGRTERDDWLDLPESGTVLGISLLAWSATLVGRWFPRLWLWPIAAYYYLASAPTRRASREFQRRVLGREPTRREVFTHILRFAQVALDRLFFAMGKLGKFELTRTGSEHLTRLSESDGGALLIGSHLGSFAAMSGGSNEGGLVVNSMEYNANSRLINGVLARFGTSDSVRVVDLTEDRVKAILSVKARIQEGEFAALLSDRVVPGARSAEVMFLGDRARISTGGFALASVLGCPVLLVFGLYRGGNRYDLFCEPFADRIRLPAGRAKEEALQELAQKYADRLAEYCKMAPDNWFNFYDFWSFE